MTFPVAHGWGVKLGSAVPLPETRLAMIGGGGYWNRDASAGYSGFDSRGGYPEEETYLEDSARTIRALIHWLTGKWSGARILCVTQNHYPNCGYAESFANHFQFWMMEYGHFIEVTELETSWEGFEPLDHDLLCVDGISTGWNYHGQTAAQDKFDYVLANGTSILANGNLYTPKYGFKQSSGGHHTINQLTIKMHSNVDGPPQWRCQFPFENEWLGEPGSGGSWGSNLWATVWYSGGYGMVPDDVNWTMGGTRLFSRCALGDCADSPYHYRDDEDGMNLVGMWKPT